MSEVRVRPVPAPGSLAALMADPVAAQVMSDRAQALARPPDPPSVVHAHALCLHFRLGESGQYGVRYRHLESVLTVPKITRVPCAPAHVAGVVNLRGEMLCVLALARMLGLPAAASPAAEVTVIVVEAAGLRVGLLVDEAIGNLVVDGAALDASWPAQAQTHHHVYAGLHEGRVMVIDLELLLAAPKLRHLAPDTVRGP